MLINDDGGILGNIPSHLSCTFLVHKTPETPHIDIVAIRHRVFDYTKNSEWLFEGDKPVVIDFYADWCGPCKMLSPIIEELNNEYGDKVNIYKVDTEAEKELSQVFSIRSIPSMLFIPKVGQPIMQAGMLPKNVLENIINDELLKEKKEGKREEE